MSIPSGVGPPLPSPGATPQEVAGITTLPSAISPATSVGLVASGFGGEAYLSQKQVMSPSLKAPQQDTPARPLKEQSPFFSGLLSVQPQPMETAERASRCGGTDRGLSRGSLSKL